jgi:hypothetical protein
VPGSENSTTSTPPRFRGKRQCRAAESRASDIPRKPVSLSYSK